MNYRLTRKELRIIEETKRENETAGAEDASGKNAEKVSAAKKIMPYVYFALTFLLIAITVRLFVYFTS